MKFNNIINFSVFELDDLKQHLNKSFLTTNPNEKNITENINQKEVLTTKEAFNKMKEDLNTKGIDLVEKGIIKKRRGRKKRISEDQLDFLGYDDFTSELLKDNNKEDNELEKSRGEAYEFFSKGEVRKVPNKNQILVNLFDENKEHESRMVTVRLPILSEKHNLVALTVDDISFDKEVSEKEYNETILNIHDIFKDVNNCLVKEGKVNYTVNAQLENDYLDAMEELSNELTEELNEKKPSLKYSENSYDQDTLYSEDVDSEKVKILPLKLVLSEKASKGLTKNYGDNLSCENVDDKNPRTGMELVSVERRELGEKTFDSVVIYPQPWMAKNTFQSAFLMRLNDLIEEKIDVKEFTKTLDTPKIKKVNFEKDNSLNLEM